jgi:hypothetical protein
MRVALDGRALPLLPWELLGIEGRSRSFYPKSETTQRWSCSGSERIVPNV